MIKRQKTNELNSPKLYLISTPIGNMDDMTYRGVNTLKMVDIIFCEDTRITSKLLAYYEIKTPLKSYHAFNENELTDYLISLIKNGKNVGIVSDAGTPLISDPGFLACREAIKEDIDVVVVPGASAVLTGLVGSGITTNNFYFHGFLNSKAGKRKQMLEELKYKTEPLVFYESPHRIKETLDLIYEVFGNRYMVIARELTKHYEEYIRGNIIDIINLNEEFRGEMVLIIEGADTIKITEELNEKSIKDHYEYYLSLGYDSKEAQKKVAKDRNLKNGEVYQALFKK